MTVQTSQTDAKAKAVAGNSAAAPAGRLRRRRSAAASPWWALLFVGPTALGLAVFYLWPTVRTLWMSMTETGPFGGSTWVGLANYAEFLKQPDLLVALRNTAVYTLIVLLGLPIAIIFAVLLNTKGLRGVGVYRTLYFLPVVTMPAAIALVWRMMYNGDYGIINQVTGLFGIPAYSWLTNPDTVLIAVSIVGIWAGLGTSIIIFLAGLQAIPESVNEAADLDGAGPVRKFISVTLPLLSPSIFFVSVIGIINALQVFDLVYMMVDKTNPAWPHAKTIVYLFYQAGFIDNQRGFAAAVAVVLLILILIMTVIQFRLQKKVGPL